MYNWSVDTKKLKKNKPAYEKWSLEQMINFGLGKSKLNIKLLKKYRGKLNLDPFKKNYLISLGLYHD